MESLVSYRNRLRVLCEDFALLAKPKSVREMFNLWKKGLKNTEWESVVKIMRYCPLRRKYWSELEVIYAVERVAVYSLHQPMLQEATFILRNEDERTYPDFQTWNPIGHLFVYAHDCLGDHTEWLRADSGEVFLWNGIYVNSLSPPRGAPPSPDRTGLRYDELGFAVATSTAARQNQGDPSVPWEEDELLREARVNVARVWNEVGERSRGQEDMEVEAEEEGEEEEDPEEDPNWEQQNMGNEVNEDNPHGDIRRREAMEEDAPFPPVIREGPGVEPNQWVNVYPIGEEPQEPMQQDPNPAGQENESPEASFEEYSGRMRAREAIRRRSAYLRQFARRRNRGSSSTNPGDASTP